MDSDSFPKNVNKPDENETVFVNENAREYVYDTEMISISEEFNIHQQYLLNHVINIQFLPNQTESTNCLFSATADANVFDNYCKYLKFNNFVAFHFSSKPTDDGTDNYFSFCTGQDLVTLINPTQDHIKFAFRYFKETYVIPCSFEDKKQLNSYENIPVIERYATDEMINYVNDQINEQKNRFNAEFFEYEKPLTYSSFLNTSIDSYFGYLASNNDEFERIIIGKPEYTHERKKFSFFDMSFNINKLLGINNVCEIELSPNKYVKCLFSANEDNVLEYYLSLIHFEKVVSYPFSSSPNSHVKFFSFCTGNDLIVLINPSIKQLNIVLNKIKKFYLIPCGLNDRNQLFFYDYLNQVQNIATDKEVKLIAEEIDQIQKSPYSRHFSYGISSSYEKFMHIAYTTFLGYLIRWQFLETVHSAPEFTSYSISDFIPLRRLDSRKTFALNWQEGKVYVLNKFQDQFKFNQSLYLYKTKKMSHIIPIFGEARSDKCYLVFGIGSRGTLKEVASSQYLDIETCRKITIQLVFTLAYFHMTYMKPCAIANDHISLDWNYNVFLTDFDDSESVINITPEQLDINNLGNVLYTLVTGELSSFNSSNSIPLIYAPIGRVFELCKKQGTTACDLILEILNDKDFYKEKVLIDNLLNELPKQFDGSIEVFNDLSYKYFKVNCKKINQSTIDFIKTLNFGPITTFQIISDENKPIEKRKIVFETNHICGFLKNVPPNIVNILISKMKNSEVVPVKKKDLDLLFEYYKFDQLQNFMRDPQLSIYRDDAKQILHYMDDIKEKFVLGKTLALSIAISHPYKVEEIEEMEANIFRETEDMEVSIPHETEDMEYEHNSRPNCICKSCEKQVDPNNCLFYLGHLYHKECVKCTECNKTYKENEDIDEYVCITPGMFLCKQHYENYQTSRTLNQAVTNEYKQKIKQNFVDELFNTNMTYDSFAQNAMEDSVGQKILEEIIPTATFHFEKSPQEIDFEELKKILGPNVIILSVEKGSTFIKIAFLSSEDFGSEDKNEYQSYVNNLEEALNTSIGKSVVGNLVDEPLINVPSDEQIKKIINKPSLNHLQNTIELDKIDISEIKKKVFQNLKNDKKKVNWEFIFSHEDLYDKLEVQLRKDLKSNPFELIITGETVIANKHFEEYNDIKSKIPSQDVTELFLYHGARLVNHQKIVNMHFLMPGEDKMEKVTDDGWYGKGIYATENIFYALKYANGYNDLQNNQKAHVICCKAIYNNSKVKNVTDNKSFKGKKIENNIKNNYGIHHALVGSSTGYAPIKECEKEKNTVWANEYVFANKYQFIPICSVTVMRKDHFILWKDENIQNNENSEYMKQLSKKMEVNVYFENSVDSALQIIRTKKYAKVKLITNGGVGLSGKSLIEQARNIIGSNFVCLVFASSRQHMEWVSKMENVLFTTSPSDFKTFAEISMKESDILAFANNLKKNYETDEYKFKINENQLLHFPNV